VLGFTDGSHDDVKEFDLASPEYCPERLFEMLCEGTIFWNTTPESTKIDRHQSAHSYRLQMLRAGYDWDENKAHRTD